MLIFVLPFVVQSVHAINHQDHKICLAKEVKHIHKKSDNCSVYHININHHLAKFSTGFYLLQLEKAGSEPFSYQHGDYTSSYRLKSPRAPPFLLF